MTLTLEVRMCYFEWSLQQTKIERAQYLAIINFIFVIYINGSRSHYTNWISAYKQSHQIKKMAAFFNKSTSTVAIKSVPVVHLKKTQVVKNINDYIKIQRK